MKTCLSVAGDPDASFVVCRTCPSLAGYAPRLRATAGYHQPAAARRWTKLVAPVQTLVFITSLTFIPAILLMMTSFTRIIIVFGLLRNALGTPSAPPNRYCWGWHYFDLFIMSPVIDKIYVDAYQPFSEEKISMQEALEKGRSRCVSLCCVRPVRRI